MPGGPQPHGDREARSNPAGRLGFDSCPDSNNLDRLDLAQFRIATNMHPADPFAGLFAGAHLGPQPPDSRQVIFRVQRLPPGGPDLWSFRRGPPHADCSRRRQFHRITWLERAGPRRHARRHRFGKINPAFLTGCNQCLTMPRWSPRKARQLHVVGLWSAARTTDPVPRGRNPWRISGGWSSND